VTTFLLVRHASHDLVGKALAGRDPAVRLNEVGRREAGVLAERLGARAVRALVVSPQVRALETAEPLAIRTQLAPQVDAALDEIDFGRWTGLTFEALGRDPLWPTWVERRSVATPPDGEPFVHVQQRIVACLARLQTTYPDDTVVVISHGDVIKTALAHYLRTSLDDLECFDVRPGSVSIVSAAGAWARVRALNWMVELPIHA
jgi:probable phosphoglycerate mutase